MQVFAIRHKPTQAWMPARMFRSSRGGWSTWIPGPQPEGWEGYAGFDKNPRIFFTLQSARNAVTAWLRGMHSEKRHYADTLDGPDEWSEIVVEPPPTERKREDMEIVALELRGA